MNDGAMTEISGAMENARSGGGEPAFRSGLSLPEGERTIRGADPRPAIYAEGGGNAVIAVNWGRDVVWRKRIRALEA